MSTLVSVKFSCTASCENISDRMKLITTLSTLSLIKRSTVPTKLMFIARKTIKDVSHLRQFLPTGSPLMMFSELLCIWALCDQPWSMRQTRLEPKCRSKQILCVFVACLPALRQCVDYESIRSRYNKRIHRKPYLESPSSWSTRSDRGQWTKTLFFGRPLPGAEICQLAFCRLVINIGTSTH